MDIADIPGIEAEETEESLAEAKKAFEQAVKKTKAENGEVVSDEAEEVAPKKAKAKKPAPDRRDEEMAELRKQIEDLSSLIKEPEVEEEEEEDVFAPVRQELKDRFGEEEAASLLKTLEGAVKPLAVRTKQLEKYLIDAAKHGRDTASRSSKTRLSKDYPQLKDKDVWGIVEAQALAMAQRDPKKWGNLEDAHDHVAKSLYGKAVEVDDDDEAKDRVASGAITTPTSTKPDRKITPYERQKAIFEYLKKNPEDVQGAKALGRSLKG